MGEKCYALEKGRLRNVCQLLLMDFVVVVQTCQWVSVTFPILLSMLYVYVHIKRNQYFKVRARIMLCICLMQYMYDVKAQAYGACARFELKSLHFLIAIVQVLRQRRLVRTINYKCVYYVFNDTNTNGIQFINILLHIPLLNDFVINLIILIETICVYESKIAHYASYLLLILLR